MSNTSSTRAVGTESANREAATHSVSVYDGDEWHTLNVADGRTLRAALQKHGLSPHGTLTRHVNCDGQGHCAACTVEVKEGAHEPDQWLDAFMDEHDLGRLACQVEVTQDMRVRV